MSLTFPHRKMNQVYKNLALSFKMFESETIERCGELAKSKAEAAATKAVDKKSTTKQRRERHL